MDNRKAAETILNLVGGADNVEDFTHCFTRLRFVLRDETVPQDDAVRRAEGVISVVRAGGQYQVVCGTKVQGIYQELAMLLEERAAAGKRSPEGDKARGVASGGRSDSGTRGAKIDETRGVASRAVTDSSSRGAEIDETRGVASKAGSDSSARGAKIDERSGAASKAGSDSGIRGAEIEATPAAYTDSQSLGAGTAKKPRKRPAGELILQKITEIFTPLIPAIAASGLIKGLLTAARILLERYGIDLAATDTYVILSAASQVIFYFMPIFLAMTCARAFRCNRVMAMVIGASLVYPQVDALIQNTESATAIFGLPVLKSAWQIGSSVKVFSYTESVIPIILAVLCMAVLERWLTRVVPEMVQLIAVPGLELIVILPLTLVVLGPVGIYVGNGIQFLYDGMMAFSTVLGGALVGGLWGVCVIFGAHRALLPIGLNDVAMNGQQNLLAFAGAANFAQGGAALGVMLKTRSREMKQIAASAALAASVVGVTEPAIYGCNLRLKKPMICAVVCGALGGAIMGIGNVYGDAFANNGVLTIFTYAAYGMAKFAFYLTGIGVAFFGAAILTYLAGFEELEAEDGRRSDE